MMKVISFQLYVPFFCSFRQTTGINVHHTYSIPPKTTIYGLLANALGLSQDDYSYMEEFNIAVCTEKVGEIIESHSIIMKKDRNDAPHVFYRTQVTKEKLIKPIYRIFVKVDGEQLLNQVFASLQNPARILYLGESDDIVELYDLKLLELIECESTVIHSPLPIDMYDGSGAGEVLRIPKKYEKTGKDKFDFEYEIVFYHQKITLNQPISCLTDQTYNIVFT